MDLSITQQEEIKTSQREKEPQAEPIVILNNRQRFFSLKFRGIAEHAEKKCDLMVYMVNWLAKVLAVEEQCPPPPISQAYRVGKQIDPKRLMPQDILVTFKDIRKKNMIVLCKREGPPNASG